MYDFHTAQRADETEATTTNLFTINPFESTRFYINVVEAAIEGGAGILRVIIGGNLARIVPIVAGARPYVLATGTGGRGDKGFRGFYVPLGVNAQVILDVNEDIPPPAFASYLNVSGVAFDYDETQVELMKATCFAHNGITSPLPGGLPLRGVTTG